MRLRLRTILIIVNVVVLLLPFVAIGLLRIYDNELIRQTESSLIAQGAVIQAMYREKLEQELGGEITSYGRPLTTESQLQIDGMTPIYPEIVLTDAKIFPPAPEALPLQKERNDASFVVGKELIFLMKKTQRITLSGIRVVNPEGVVVSSTRGEIGQSIYHREEVKRALDGEVMRVLRQRISDSPDPSWDSISRRTKVRVFIGIPIIEGKRIVGAVILSRTPLSLQKALYKNRNLFIGFFSLIIIVALLISILTAVTIQRPMVRLIKQMRRIAAGEKVSPITNPRTTEVEELSDALVEMAGRIEARSSYISNFARTVSHEFKTPIASIRGAVELLQDHYSTMNEEERKDFLNTIDDESHRMQKLLTGLLKLARADMHIGSADPFRLVKECKSSIQLLKEKMNIEIRESYDSAVLEVDLVIPKEFLHALLSNLLMNADQAGATHIEFKIFRAENNLLLSFKDDGPGIPEGEAEKVFQPFYTTKRELGGTGLGLSILRTMMEKVDAELLLRSSSQGCVFEVVFRDFFIT